MDDKEQKRFFFDTDGDSHVYMIPLELRTKWNEMTMDDIEYDDYDKQEEFETLFGQYTLGGGYSQYSFVDPQEIPR